MPDVAHDQLPQMPLNGGGGDVPLSTDGNCANVKSLSNTRSERLSLAAGGLAENAFQNTLLLLANPIFNIGMHVSPVVIGIAMAIPRFWEMLIDPWIGGLSDRSRSRWGRRVPWIVMASLACIVTFGLVWLVPLHWSPLAKGYWLIVFSFLFYTAFSFFAVPYAAMTIDETREGVDRTSVMSSRVAFANAGALVMSWLYWLCQRDIFGSTIEGIRWVGPLFGLAVGLTVFLPVWMALRKRRKRAQIELLSAGHLSAGTNGDGVNTQIVKNVLSAQKDGENISHAKGKGASVKQGSFMQMLKIPAMRRVVAAMMTILLGFTLVGHLGFYILAYYVCDGDLKNAGFIGGVCATVTAVVGIVACPLVAGIANRIGKHRTLLIMLGVGVAANLSQWWLVTPANPYLIIIPAVGNTLGLVGFLSLMPDFLGDISDDYLARTGKACQGMLVAIYGVAVKLGASLALMATGYILIICGFEAGMQLHDMGDTIFRMRILAALVPAVAGVGAMIAMSRFRVGVGVSY